MHIGEWSTKKYARQEFETAIERERESRGRKTYGEDL